jgi:hypothetical protein
MVVLVELADGSGLVRRQDGDVLLTHDVRDDRGQPLRDGDRYVPMKTWLADDRSLVGGLLPHGAVSVEVIDSRGTRVSAVIGDGVYAAALDERNDGDEPIVCCRDASGEVVRLPVPDEYPRASVPDAEEPCPGCEAIDYEECAPTEDWRGGRARPDGSTEPGPIVVCRVCGHQEREGAIHRFTSPENEGETARAERIARLRAEHRVQQWHAHSLTLRAVAFPIYAVESWPAQINGSGSVGDRLTELTVAHTDTEGADLFERRPRLEITTSTEAPRPSELALAQQQLEHLVQDEVTGTHADDLSNAAMTLYFRALSRRRRAAALDAVRSESQLSIDGAPATFLTLRTPSGRWVAVRRHEDLTITIAARDADPATIALEPITDPAARLLEPRPPEWTDAE